MELSAGEAPLMSLTLLGPERTREREPTSPTKDTGCFARQMQQQQEREAADAFQVR